MGGLSGAFEKTAELLECGRILFDTRDTALQRLDDGFTLRGEESVTELAVEGKCLFGATGGDEGFAIGREAVGFVEDGMQLARERAGGVKVAELEIGTQHAAQAFGARVDVRDLLQARDRTGSVTELHFDQAAEKDRLAEALVDGQHVAE